MVHHALRGFIESVFLAIPHGDGCMHLHGIVRLDRRDVDLVDLDGCCRKYAFGVAAMAQNTGSTRLAFWRKCIVEGGCHVELVCVVINVNGCCCGLCLLECFGDDRCDILAPVVNSLVLEGGTALAVATAGSVAVERHDIAVMQHEEHAGHLFCCAAVDTTYLAAGDGRAYRHGVDHVRRVVVRGVERFAGGLERTVDAGQRSANDSRWRVVSYLGC